MKRAVAVSSRRSRSSILLTLLAAAWLALPLVATAQEGSPLDNLQERMSSDPQTMDTISDLRDSPDMKAVLADPALMDAIQRGDISALLANPKIAKLAADPKVRQLAEKYGR